MAIWAVGASLLGRNDWDLGLVAISALPWAVPVFIVTFIAQQGLQLPDRGIAPTLSPGYEPKNGRPAEKDEAGKAAAEKVLDGVAAG